MIRKDVYLVLKNTEILFVNTLDGYNTDTVQAIIGKKVKRIPKKSIFAKCKDIKEAKKQRDMILTKMKKYTKQFSKESEQIGELFMNLNTFTEKVLMKLEFEKLEEILESKAKNEQFREYCKQNYVNAVNISKVAKDVNSFALGILNWNELCK